MKSTAQYPKSKAIRDSFERDGFQIVSGVLTHDGCDDLIEAISEFAPRGNRKSAGLRNLFQNCPRVRAIALSEKLAELVSSHLRGKLFPARVLFFDKTESANWSVPWHQDLAIAVEEKIETREFGPWSVKAGVIHVQPPIRVLQNIVTVRLHLDDCDESNGALKVLPGSHAHGILSDEQMNQWKQNASVLCKAGRGDALLMRPLLLHASSAASQPRHRRVLHIEYASDDLPGGLQWFGRV